MCLPIMGAKGSILFLSGKTLNAHITLNLRDRTENRWRGHKIDN